MTFIQSFWLLVGLLHCLGSLSSGEPTPIVIWHGSGDTSEGLPKLIKRLIEDSIDGVYVKRIKIGMTLLNEFQNSFLVHPNTQVLLACQQIRDDVKLSSGYHGIGLSQGGVFLRAVAQRCPEPQMKNLITLGAPHQGVYGLPRCQSIQSAACEIIRNVLFLAAYKSSTQRILVPATYWHDPFNEVMYRSQSTFLSDINNERWRNEDYSQNLKKLEKFVMVKFRNDTVTQPRETHWFEFYVPGQDIEILPLRKSKLYLEDALGLAQMDANGRLVFLEVDGEHLIFTDDWFNENIIMHLFS